MEIPRLGIRVLRWTKKGIVSGYMHQQYRNRVSCGLKEFEYHSILNTHRGCMEDLFISQSAHSDIENKEDRALPSIDNNVEELKAIWEQ